MDDRIKIGDQRLPARASRCASTAATSTTATSPDTLGEYLEFVPVCPEVEAGFPVPRETFRLVGDPQNPAPGHHPHATSTTPSA